MHTRQLQSGTPPQMSRPMRSVTASSNRRPSRPCLSWRLHWLAFVAMAAPLPGAELPPPSSAPVSFESDIRPLLEQRCYACHGEANAMNGLRLDRKADALAGGVSGTAILPGDSASSRLIHMVAGYKVKVLMPPAGDPLNASEIGLLRAWIDQGAVWPESAGDEPEPDDSASRSDHWAFQPIRRPESATRRKSDRLLRAREAASKKGSNRHRKLTGPRSLRGCPSI